MKRNTRQRVNFYFFLLPAIIGFSCLTVYPFFSSLSMSFTNRLLYYPGDAKFVGLKNYIYLLTKFPLFWPALKNSLIYAFFTVVFSNVLAIISAILLTRKKPGCNFFRILYYIPSILPSVALIIMFSFIFDPSYGIVNKVLMAFGVDSLKLPLWLSNSESALSTLIIISLWGFGGKMIIDIAGINAIPSSCYEAASLDGANVVQQCFKITLPLLMPSISYGIVTGIISGMQVFTEVFVGAASVNFYVPVLYNLAYTGTYQMGLASAMAWLLFVVTAALLGMNKLFAKLYMPKDY